MKRGQGQWAYKIQELHNIRHTYAKYVGSMSSTLRTIAHLKNWSPRREGHRRRTLFL